MNLVGTRVTLPSGSMQHEQDENGRWIHLSSAGNAAYAEAILPFLLRAAERTAR